MHSWTVSEAFTSFHPAFSFAIFTVCGNGTRKPACVSAVPLPVWQVAQECA